MSNYEMGLLFESGGPVRRDKATAADYYKQAADSGDNRAMYRLALLEMKHNPQASANLMRESARLGNNDAAWWLVHNLFYGVRIEQNYEEAFCWLSELSSRGVLSSKAQLIMGICYYYGNGTEINYEASVHAMLDALEMSGRDCWGIPFVDNRTSREKMPDTLSDSDVREICHILGECYYYGRGVERDYCRALKYLLHSVQDGEYIYPNKDAEYLIGTCYYFHRGTKQDIATALYWLTGAEELGSVEAQELLKRRSSNKR